jgi:hypothetical protein
VSYRNRKVLLIEIFGLTFYKKNPLTHLFHAREKYFNGNQFKRGYIFLVLYIL